MKPNNQNFCLIITVIMLFLGTAILMVPKVSAQDSDTTKMFIGDLQTNSPVFRGEDLVLVARGGTSWTWAGPNSYSSSDQYNVINNVSNSYSGTYYLTITDTIYDTITYWSEYIDVMDRGPIISILDDKICLYNTFTVTSIYTGPGYSYTWNSSISCTFTPSNTVASPTLSNFASTGWTTITLTVTDNSTFTHIGSVYVEVLNCCTDDDVALINNTTISNYLATVNNFSPTTVINGIVTMDVNFTMPSVVKELIILPVGTIDVLTDISFKMSNVYVHGCDEMWEQITVFDKAKLTLDTCFIQDGVNTVFGGSGGPYIELNMDTLEDNMYGITTWFNSYPDLRLNENVFKGTLDGMNLPPHQGEVSHAGIQSICSPVVNVNFVNKPNYFEYLQCGITFTNCSMFIGSDATIFSNIGNFSGSNFNSGYSICGNYTSVYQNTPYYDLEKQGNSGTYSQYDILDCQNGILATRINIKAYDNLMYNVGDGFLINQCKNRDINIHNNVIDCLKDGIFLYQNDQTNTSIEVYENEINLAPDMAGPVYTSACIKINELGNDPSLNAIHHNALYLDEGANFGILNTTSHLASIYENVIEMVDYQYNRAGIKLIDCEKNEVKCNYITGPGYQSGSANNGPFGMQIVETEGSTFSCNEMDETYTGTLFDESCSGTTFRGNKFNDHTIGLHYTSTSVTGDQPYYGNKFYRAQYPSYGALCDGNYQLSIYTVGPSCGYCLPNPVAPTQNWWNYDQYGQSSYDCDETEPPQCDDSQGGGYMMMLGDTSLNSSDYVIAAGTLTYPIYSDELTWVSKRYLYNKLNTDTSLLTGITLMQNFYDSTAQISAGQFQEVETGVRASQTLNQLTAAYLDSLENLSATMIDSLNILKNLLYNCTTYNDSIVYLSSIGQLSYSLKNIRQVIHDAIIGLNYLKDQAINSVLNANALLSSNTDYETNEKTVNEIYLNTVARGKSGFTQQQLDQLKAIALQCPLAGGPAVYKARSLYSIVSDSLLDDYSICLQVGYIKSKGEFPSTKNFSDIHFSVYPNPASSLVNLYWDKPMDKECTLKLFSTIGEIQSEHSFNLTSTSLSINTQEFRPGVYYIRIYSSGTSVSCGKLIVIE